MHIVTKKKIIMKNSKYIFITLTIILAACKSEEENDVKSPEMVMQQPINGEVLKVGDEFHIEMHLSDETELKSCIVEIIHDSTHKSALHGDEPWAYSKLFDFSGMKTSSIHEHMPVPDSVGHDPIAKGHYTFKATCEDKTGNIAEEIVGFIIDEE